MLPQWPVLVSSGQVILIESIHRTRQLIASLHIPSLSLNSCWFSYRKVHCGPVTYTCVGQKQMDDFHITWYHKLHTQVWRVWVECALAFEDRPACLPHGHICAWMQTQGLPQLWTSVTLPEYHPFSGNQLELFQQNRKRCDRCAHTCLHLPSYYSIQLLAPSILHHTLPLSTIPILYFPTLLPQQWCHQGQHWPHLH